MKCEECGGTGKVQKWFYERTGFGKCEKVCGDVKCEWCNGTGEVEQTEEEYIQTCNHKELTEILFRMIVHGSVIRPDRKYISEWLKQPHREE